MPRAKSAMDALLGLDFAVAEKDRLYRCLDRVLEHKSDLFVHLSNAGKICSTRSSICSCTT
jgi:hypothetical protein